MVVCTRRLPGKWVVVGVAWLPFERPVIAKQLRGVERCLHRLLLALLGLLEHMGNVFQGLGSQGMAC